MQRNVGKPHRFLPEQAKPVNVPKVRMGEGHGRWRAMSPRAQLLPHGPGGFDEVPLTGPVGDTQSNRMASILRSQVDAACARAPRLGTPPVLCHTEHHDMDHDNACSSPIILFSHDPGNRRNQTHAS